MSGSPADLGAAIAEWLQTSPGPKFPSKILELAQQFTQKNHESDASGDAVFIRLAPIVAVDDQAGILRTLVDLRQSGAPDLAIIIAANALKLESLPSVVLWSQVAYQQRLELAPQRVAEATLDEVVRELRNEMPSNNQYTTASGRAQMTTDDLSAPLNSVGGHDFDLETARAENPLPRFELVEFVIVHASVNVDRYWPFVVPAVLNLIDDVRLPAKIAGMSLLQTLMRGYWSKIEATGLVKVFWDAIVGKLHTLPPSASVEESRVVLGPAVAALLRLASTDKTRLNYVMRHGPLNALGYTSGDVEFTIFLLAQLVDVVNACGSLTIAHLGAIVKVFRAVTYDPFVDLSPSLIEAACAMMATVLRWAWPRAHAYKYDILLGLAKTDSLDTECSLLLQQAVDGLEVEVGELKVATKVARELPTDQTAK